MSEDLIKPKPGEKFAAAIAAVNDVKMTAAEFLQAQRHAGHRAHETWNPSSRNLPDQSQIRDNRGPTSRERTPSGSRCSGNCPCPPLSPIRLDRLPLLESMTPRLLNK